MRSLSIYYIILILLTLPTGCEKDVKDVRLPPFEQKLVLASFISPSDSVSFIFAGSNRRIYGELGLTEQTGILSGTISDGTHEVALDTAKYGLQVSRDKMPIRYGKTYSLRITSDKGLTATSSCIVPDKRDFIVSADTFSVPAPYVPQGYFPRQTNIKLSITDIPGEENYYRLKAKCIGYYVHQASGKQYVYTHDLYIEKEYLTDTGNDGKDLVVKSQSGIDYFLDDDSAFLEVYLYNLEMSYYLYHRSLENYNSDENPFTEVSPVYSNVTGGLGIFTSYTVDTMIFRLK